jgi:hypothetical protein
MIRLGPERHVRTADLLRFTDGEGSAPWRERVAAHLAACAECTAASERLRAGSAFVLDRLAVLDERAAEGTLPATFAELAKRGGRSRDNAWVVDWRRAAAIVLFLGAGAAVARPAVGWLQRRSSTEPTAQPVATEQPTSETPASPPVDTTGAVYSFTPTSSELRIDFAAAEPDAELSVRADDGTAASFEVQSTEGLPPVLILPNGVRITNGTNRGTHYTLALSRDVAVLTVSIAGGTERHIVAESLPARIRLKEMP